MGYEGRNGNWEEPSRREFSTKKLLSYSVIVNMLCLRVKSARGGNIFHYAWNFTEKVYLHHGVIVAQNSHYCLVSICFCNFLSYLYICYIIANYYKHYRNNHRPSSEQHRTLVTSMEHHRDIPATVAWCQAHDTNTPWKI